MILITRPLYDKTTHYLFHWSDILVKEAERFSVVYNIMKKRVNRKTIDGFLRKQSPKIVIFNGHGNASLMAGQDNETLISSENAQLLAHKIVYMRACEAGQILGKEIINAGAKGFIGYTASFMFPYDRDMVSRPLQDEVAKPCLECSNQVGLGLIRGNTAKEAHEASMRIYQERIDALSTSNTPPYRIWFLQWNMINQVCYESTS